MARSAAVAGQFYPGSEKALTEELDEMIPEVGERIDAIGAVSPHAGYMYSGRVAGEVYARIKPRKTFIVLSPNHTGYGARFALSLESWETPLGKIDIDTSLAEAVLAKTNLIESDTTAHAFEHSVEVQLPFVQRIAPQAKIIPITVQHGSLAELKEVAEAVSSSVREVKSEAVIIASSDMTHYESRKSAKEKDKKAIDAVLELDAEKLMKVVESNNISMCGYIPSAIMLMAAKELGAKKAELIKYTDSGEVTGDTLQVVGYAGIIVY